MQKDRETVLQIRCSSKVRRDFKMLAVRLGVKNYEELLIKLIEKANNEWFAEKVY
jgi:hypothetical protein